MFDLIPFERWPNSFVGRDWRDLFGAMQNQGTGMCTDIVDKGDHFELTAEMPGMRKEDILVHLDGDILIIKAEQKDEKKVEEDRYVRRERSVRSMSRSFNVKDIRKDEINVSYTDGVLNIHLPKLEPNQEGPVKRDLPIG